MTLPIAIKGCGMNFDNFKHFDGKQFSKYTDEYSLAYGHIVTNGNYLATITMTAGDCYVPVLTTYKLTGEKIDQKTISVGGCGSGPGFNCEEFMIIRKDFSIYTSDSISTFEYDSLGNEIEGTRKYYVNYIKGKMLKNGKIEMSNPVNKPLPQSKN
ncbi:hypothetical protein [Flectobacillus roseus]|uniref:hypothetical protein n=1 Tax=Flectobacillus roseus TaxID=502259 RepID=UPI0024B7F3F1|nr:hypothetical protein [Flectobacillus roseus]MDI9871744.1 hypothetical protein [Flectobacillus roseus]